MKEYHIYANSFRGNYSFFTMRHPVRENLMRKLYEIFKVLRVQERIITAETIRVNMVLLQKGFELHCAKT